MFILLQTLNIMEEKNTVFYLSIFSISMRIFCNIPKDDLFLAFCLYGPSS